MDFLCASEELMMMINNIISTTGVVCDELIDDDEVSPFAHRNWESIIAFCCLFVPLKRSMKSEKLDGFGAEQSYKYESCVTSIQIDKQN
jgi:hypothetical protein